MILEQCKGVHCVDLGESFQMSTTRQYAIAVVRRLFKMGPKMVERRLKTVRRFFHPLLVAMNAMLKNVTTLIQFPPRQEVCDAYLRRRQLRIDE